MTATEMEKRLMELDGQWPAGRPAPLSGAAAFKAGWAKRDPDPEYRALHALWVASRAS